MLALENIKYIEKELEKNDNQYLLPKVNSPKVIIVSKTRTIDEIIPLLDAGYRIFGENRVQEAQEKWLLLKEKYSNIELHLIGSLQTNKVKEAVALFDVIETVDRLKLATIIANEINRTGQKIECFVQINTGEEVQKSGVFPKDADELILHCQNELKLAISGVMCIPPIDEETAMHFALLKKIAERNNINNLSMGMSSDYKLAAAMGATHIRIGTAIFGLRN